MIVLDANAAISIVRDTPEGNAFMSLMADGEKALAPFVFCSEVANGLRTLVHANVIDGSAALLKLGEALALVDDFVPDSTLLPAALAEALLHDHPAYDMFYLILARERGATLFTCDKRLIALCDQSGIDCTHVIDLDS